ncbi:MAG: AmmeMemoRadiSam system radical SAM enzyme [bacterium]|nr:MAG: AmmeMemoRadiSam system radical SAM enzyme [bacterium]
MSECLSSYPFPGGSHCPGGQTVFDRPLLDRRRFLGLCGTGLCLLSTAFLPPPARAAGNRASRKGMIRTKLSPYFTALEGAAVRCELCPRRCRVEEGGRGFCRVRENRDGKYFSLVYGNPCAVHLDPIEKKPLFHVLPSTWTLSIATAGCNLACKFCQNWEISQASPEEVYSFDFPPERVVQAAVESGARSIAYTYVEPMVFFEYMIDICRLAREAGLLNICHSNAFVRPEPLRELCTVMDAANCDLKGFTEDYYRDMCRGRLGPVLDSLKAIKDHGVHLEITNLVIPTRNDDLSRVEDMCRWIRGELGDETPVHFSRFYPLYRLRSLPPTPVSTLEKVRAAALSTGLRFVYIGNVPGHAGQHTSCPGCGKPIIVRTGFMVEAVHMSDGRCTFCGSPVPGIWARRDNRGQALQGGGDRSAPAEEIPHHEGTVIEVGQAGLLGPGDRL